MEFSLIEQKFAGFWRRAGAALIDSLLLIPVGLAGTFAFTMGKDLAWLAFAVELLSTAVCFLYMPILLSRYGRTVGKWAVGVRVIDKAGQKISFGRGILRQILSVPSMVAGLVMYSLLYQAVSEQGLNFASFMEVARWLHAATPSVLRKLNDAATYLTLVDVLVVLTNRERRSLHDFIAGTYVIRG